ncbi:hypothetical protein APSETT444_010245 [Aspergillus pseudonomiae]
MGHTARGCKEERVVHERVEVKCVNCSAVGHRARDCTEPRRDRFACRNCGYSLSLFKLGHTVKRCPSDAVNDTGIGDNPDSGNNGNQNAAADDGWATDNTGIADHSPAEGGGWKPGW